MKKWLAIGGLILVTVIWGGGFVASDMALGSMKPFQIMMVRFLLASVLMGMISMGQHKKEGKLEKRAGAIKAGILMGIALFAGFALQIIGLQYTTPSKNAFLTALNVVIVPFIAFIILKKKVGMKGIIGAIMSVIGVALLSLNGNLTLSLGDGLTLLCAVGFAFQIFFTGEFVKKYPASVLNMVQMITAFVLSAVSLVIFGENDFQVTTQGWLSVLYLGVISTTVCYLLQTACQKYVDETKVLVLFFVVGVVKTCGSFTEVKRPEHALKIFIRFAITKGVVTYGLELMMALFNIIQGVTSTIMQTAGFGSTEDTVLPDEIIEAVEDCGFFESIPLWAVTLIGGLFITVLSFIMIMSVYGRFFRLYLYTAIAPIPLSSFAGEPSQNIGRSFLKSYAAVCLEGAIVVLACIIFSLFASSPPVVNPDAAVVTMVWSYIGELIFNMLVLVGAVKMSDRVVREMMGL